jgi:hypothetical protein
MKSKYYRVVPEICIRISDHPCNIEEFFVQYMEGLSIIVGNTPIHTEDLKDLLGTEITCTEDQIKAVVSYYLTEAYENCKDELDISSYQHMEFERVANEFGLQFFELQK